MMYDQSDHDCPMLTERTQRWDHVLGQFSKWFRLDGAIQQ